MRRVEPDDLVTMSEIAERRGRSRESVRVLVAGRRGRGDFPAPVSHLRSRSRLWRWPEVAERAGLGSPKGRAAHAARRQAPASSLEARACLRGRGCGHDVHYSERMARECLAGRGTGGGTRA